MSSSAVKNAGRRLKLFWLALRLSRLSPDQLSEWISSEEHHAEVEALMLPDLFAPNGGWPRPPPPAGQNDASTAPLDDTDEYLAFLRERPRRLAKPLRPTPLQHIRSWFGKRR